MQILAIALKFLGCQLFRMLQCYTEHCETTVAASVGICYFVMHTHIFTVTVDFCNMFNCGVEVHITM